MIWTDLQTDRVIPHSADRQEGPLQFKEEIARELYTHNLPELDLLVRTSGELRISNFLLWQSAYAEIHVTETLWPDFRRVHLLEAIVAYQQTGRRCGGLKDTEPLAAANG